MDDVPIRLLWLIVICLLGGGYFAATETALASVNKIRMMSLAENGSKGAKRVLYIENNFDKAITTLLIGNNIMHIACATIATVITTEIFGSAAVALSTVITTVVVFLIAEMLPKSFAKQFADELSITVSGSVILLMKLLFPLAFVFNAISDFFSKPFKAMETEEVTVTEEELKDIIENISEETDIDEEKGELMQSAMEFGTTTAGDVMTPWERVTYIPYNINKEELVALIKSIRISRLPVMGQRGTVRGVLQLRKYLKEYIRTDGNITLEECMDKPRFVPDDMPVDELLQRMSKNKTHICFVRNVSGQTVGIVTMEDILEELVGEIYDEDDTDGGNAQ